MRQWLIPAIALVVVGAAGVGVGWSINEWDNGKTAESPRGQASSNARADAELDAQRCAAALEAAGQFTTSERGAGIASRDGFPDEIQSAIDRYCN